MNELKIFKNEEFGEVRVFDMNGEPYFVGKDITKILGYTNSSKALIDHVEDEDKLNNESLSSLGQRGGWLINESGLYSLILSSKLPSAKKFKRWVTSDVLPSIRRNGGYIANQENLTTEQLLANAVLVAQNVIEEKDKLIESMKPKADFADAVATAENNVNFGQFAAAFQNNSNIKFGRNNILKFCRDHKYLCSTENLKNKPTQQMLTNGYMTYCETVNQYHGTTAVSFTPLLTGRGQVWLTNKLLDYLQ